MGKIYTKFISMAIHYDVQIGLINKNNESMLKLRREYYKDMYNNPSVHIIHIIHGKKYNGFTIIEERKENDYLICETYIGSRSRNKGYMTKTLDSFIDNHKGHYEFDVIQENKNSFSFWEHYFSKKGKQLHKIENEYDWCDTYEVYI